ncbi:ABC transporter permease [Bordetella pertussis]|nr:branched-chain amino acid ABC transporter permease [Bordetella pertussis]ETA64819.1 branched-chain amino acid ABC transporter, permease protein [Bordetella pertussis CHLA-11]ETG98389.1 branched-chain amino acid ABC transporter, permease protein [Bordetella pertussis 2250905]ETH03022.1 branched-chain amino acid ABC transporter, permease protein [Bordetella pertussis 2356847]ETH07200.1 branched-chain amino acid ABC transporter, permease protein [Bordetella pertussis 2371640]ETH13298.1 branche
MMTEFLQYLVSGLVVGCIYGLVAIGFTAVYNVTNIVNFAQGEVSMLGALATASMLAAGVPLPLAVVACVLLVGALGVVLERFALRPVGNHAIRGIIITIGISVVLQGLAVVTWGTDAQSLPAFSGSTPISVYGVSMQPQAFWVLGTSVVLMAVLYVFLTRTYLGRSFRACAMNPQAAALMGIPSSVMRGLGFFLSGAVGAIAGIIIAPIALMQYDSGAALGIKGFVACIMGGFGNPVGAAAGGLLLGLLEAFSAGYISSGFKNAIAFVLLLAFLLVRPGGLFGEFDKVKR